MGLPSNVATSAICSMYPYYCCPIAPTTDNLGLSQTPYVNCYDKASHFDKNRELFFKLRTNKLDQFFTSPLQKWWSLMTSTNSQFDQKLRAILVTTWIYLFNRPDKQIPTTNSEKLKEIRLEFPGLHQTYVVPSNVFPVHPLESLQNIEIVSFLFLFCIFPFYVYVLWLLIVHSIILLLSLGYPLWLLLRLFPVKEYKNEDPQDSSILNYVFSWHCFSFGIRSYFLILAFSLTYIVSLHWSYIVTFNSPFYHLILRFHSILYKKTSFGQLFN